MDMLSGEGPVAVELLTDVNPNTSIISNSNPISAGQATTSTDSYYYTCFINNELTNSGTITSQRYSNNATNYFILDVIDFVGYTTFSGVSAPVADQSLLKSFESFDFTHTSDYHILEQTKGQNLNNCVPFMTSNSSSTGGFLNSCRPEVFFLDNMIHLKTIDERGSRYINLNLVEFNPNRIKIQSGHYVLSSSDLSTTVTIDEVDLDHAFLIHNWHGDTSNYYWAYHLIRGTFSSNVELLFDRGVLGSTVIMGSWWVVEALDNAFEVSHVTFDTVVTNASASVPYTYGDLDRTLLVSSYKKDTSTNPDPRYNSFKSYTSVKSPNLFVNHEKATASTASYHSIEVITFAEGEGVIVQSNSEITMGTAEVYVEYDITPVDRSLSMVISPLSFSNASLTTTTDSYCERGFIRHRISDDGTKVECNSCSVPTITNGAYEVIQWPQPVNKKIDGYITENSAPVARQVYMYDRESGELVGGVMSDISTGFYEIVTSVSGEHFVVALDDDIGTSYNALIADKIVPDELL